MADKKPPAPKTMPGWVNFVIGGLSGMFAICVVQPMDLIKTRMQLAGPKGSIGEVVGGIMKSDGVFGFYNGLSAALFRQATYTTGRLGCFNAVFDYYQSNFGTPNLAAKIGLGSIAGGVGALIGNPAEIALIRMTADGRLPPDKRRNYKHVIDALARICREEGTGALMRGMTATVTRAMVVNGAQLSTYQQSREMLLARGMADGIPLHATCAMIAGLVTSAASLPVDIVKTRYNKLIPMVGYFPLKPEEKKEIILYLNIRWTLRKSDSLTLLLRSYVYFCLYTFVVDLLLSKRILYYEDLYVVMNLVDLVFKG